MKLKTTFLASLLLNASASPVRAADTFGLGIVLGEPSGITFKSWQSASRAIDGGIAFSFNRFFLAYADYLFHARASDLIRENSRFITLMRPYAGIGALASFYTGGTLFGSAIGVGARIPLGLEWKLSDPSIGFFIEVVPGLMVIPATAGYVSAGIGARFYF